MSLQYILPASIINLFSLVSLGLLRVIDFFGPIHGFLLGGQFLPSLPKIN